MKIDKRYEIRIVVGAKRESLKRIRYFAIGDIYDNFLEFKKEHPNSKYKFGFCVVDTETGYVPEECNDWNDTVEEALFDYEDNCC